MQINLTAQYISDNTHYTLSKRPRRKDTVNLSLKQKVTDLSFATYEVSGRMN